MNDAAKRLESWIEAYDLTHQQACELIEKRTGDRLPVTTLRAWLADPRRSYARPCPGWAPVVLEDAIARGIFSDTIRVRPSKR